MSAWRLGGFEGGDAIRPEVLLTTWFPFPLVGFPFPVKTFCSPNMEDEIEF
jgi:hypothetical protein